MPRRPGQPWRRAIGYCANRHCPDRQRRPHQTPHVATALEDEDGLIRHCEHCGQALVTACPGCQRTLYQLHRFCARCGQALVAAIGELTAEERAALLRLGSPAHGTEDR